MSPTVITSSNLSLLIPCAILSNVFELLLAEAWLKVFSDANVPRIAESYTVPEGVNDLTLEGEISSSFDVHLATNSQDIFVIVDQ